ncbi:hypothetical protein [Echinicola vietnamensis]|uniref:DUF3185 domain-containing protein n=1 Tax=Echinicola vietnamensis (strain DSM 17526 / LMG 23754 / KMM 6221) TaxID=926556 RepID=L0G2K9_ECHVK|nr:hypothetical protein [Echinicola vietnamensis]AGA79236.1 hypothetical protein Echvi_2998 [Echinicola vietnamensis DSM 17526]
MKLTGFILIIIGIAMFIFTGFSFTTEETVIDAGPLKVNKTEENDIGWPPYAGGIAIAGGIILLAISRKK